MPVCLLATLDTKGVEAGFVRDLLASMNVSTTLIDAGAQGSPAVPADIPREKVFEAAGTTLAAVLQRGDRGEAVTKAAEGAAKIIRDLHARGEVSGVLALGGSAGTTIGTTAMRALPIGVPKLMVSTLASGQTRHWVGDKDILMLNSVVDILGVNRVSRKILTQAARAMVGMATLRNRDPEAGDKPLVAATMFGVTTACVERARAAIEKAGYEVLVFHATGNGGQAMESLIADGLISGVLDVTTTELADELVGGVLSAGPDRLTAAARAGVPQVVSVGATDMVNFFAPETIPGKFHGRKFHRHNPTVTLMRTTTEENAKIGEEIGSKLARSKGPVEIFLPRKGVSAIDAEGQPFNDPTARKALFDAIRTHAGHVKVTRPDVHINDPSFADAVSARLLEMMASVRTKQAGK